MIQALHTVRRTALLLLIALALAAAPSAFAYAPAAQPLPHPALAPIPAAAQFDASGHLDPERATQGYLNTLPLEKRQASDKYFQGGYWLLLWDALYAIAVLLLLLYSGISARLRDLAVRITRFVWLQNVFYSAVFILLFSLLQAPLTWYESFYREHLYQQSNQALGGWLHDQLIGLVLVLLFGALLIPALYKVAQRLPKTWHLWAAAVVWIFSGVIVLIAPVFLSPLFNTYTRIEDPAVTAPILSMAHANGIPVNDLYQVDASKQTTRVSANVSGLFKTTRITLNDNLLRTASLEEIEAVTGHEMGHYVLHHILHGLIEDLILFLFIFTVLRAWLESLQRRRGARWGSTSIYDIAMLPGVFLIVTVIGLLLTPISNTKTRLQEHEADMFGLNASRQPDGFAQSMLKLGQYRKLSPSPLEEMIFFDHPSGHTRILDAMRWKSQNAGTPGYK